MPEQDRRDTATVAEQGDRPAEQGLRPGNQADHRTTQADRPADVARHVAEQAQAEQAQGEARETQTRLDPEQIASGGGLRYQQGHRDPGLADDAPRSSIPVDDPDLRQQGTEYGGPAPDDQATLNEHGYPKLGGKLPSRVTQVEHGPYAGGSQQGDTKDRQGGGPLDDSTAPR